MKKILLGLLFIIGASTTALGQGFQEHTITVGETLSTIVEKYQVTPYELYQLNPDAKEGLKVGEVLVLLKNSQYPFDSTLIGLMKYRVKKKETLSSIAKAHGVSEINIKKYNTRLYANQVEKGDKIKIPVFDRILNAQVVTAPKEVVEVSTTKIIAETISHVVQPKEGKYGISKKYGITILELEAQNPEIVDGLKIGQVLTIAKKAEVEAVISDESNLVADEFAYYTVKPKEGFYSLTKKLGVSKDSLVVLNPSLVDGLKLGMILKYPKIKLDKLELPTYNLIDSISSFDRQHITLMLPLGLQKIVNNDSTSNINKLVKRRTINIALDYYSGALMAVDSLKKIGLSTRLRVFDTEYNSRNANVNSKRIATLLSNPFEENEIVIGPLAESNVALVAKGLEEKNIPVIAPRLLKNTTRYSNLYETMVPVAIQREKMIAFLEEYSEGKTITIVADKKMLAIKDELLLKFSNAKVIVPEDEGSIQPEVFDGVLSKEKENIIIVEASKVGLVATVTSILDTKAKNHKITLFTTSSKKMFDDRAIANRYKAKLNFHYPAVRKDIIFSKGNSFALKYKKTYGKLPNNDAIRAFDLVMDVALRQAVIPVFEESVSKIGKTSYLENKFNYDKNITKGFVNKSMYILRYTPTLDIVEAELIKAQEGLEK